MSEPAFLAAIRTSYDTVADAYVERVPPPADLDPLSRAMFGAFAELVRGRGPVADLGCGPGRITAYLGELGVSAFGVDLSPRMIELARAAHPDLRFDVGSMTALDIADDELAGILAFYSTFHAPPEHLPTVFAEFHRTLAPNGVVLLGSYIGDHERRRPALAHGGHPVSYESYLLPADHIDQLLALAGLTVTDTLIRKPDERTTRAHACFIARKNVT